MLTGGLGARLAEETSVRPKPMVEIGGRPIFWRILTSYPARRFDELVLRLGYKAYCLKEFFSNHFLHMSDATFNMRRRFWRPMDTPRDKTCLEEQCNSGQAKWKNE